MRVALTHAEEALALAQTVDEPELLARTFNILAYLHPQVGQWSSAAQCAEEAVARYRQLGDQAMIVDSLCVLSEAQANLGEAATSQTVAESGLALAVEIGNGWGQVNGDFHLALALPDQGDATSVLEDAQDACRLAIHHNLVTLLAVAHIVLGNVEREMGDLAAAIATHQAADPVQ